MDTEEKGQGMRGSVGGLGVDGRGRLTLVEKSHVKGGHYVELRPVKGDYGGEWRQERVYEERDSEGR